MGLFDKINLPAVKNVIVVASGKGGVGKSTVSVNLAIALARNGYKVGLVDADIYGPSIPKMFGVENARPQVEIVDDKEYMTPIEKYGVKIMSIGFFVDKSQGLIWRGPKAAGAITQLFENTVWGELDYLLVDFPPGTGDIQLTTIQKVKLAGAIIVTTPQEVAVNDARKAASMFLNSDLNVPVLGIIENMSWFTPEKHPDEKYYIFGQGGGQTLANECNAVLLGQVPLVAEVGLAAEEGKSVFNQSNKIPMETFETIAKELLAKV
jgi:ATP-binding protein involved in chromosome partitioning